MIFFAFLILVISVVYVLQNQNIITIPQISIPLITVTPTIPAPTAPTLINISSQQSDDCIGTWQNVGTCDIDRCDPSNIGRALGKQTQEFLVQKYSENKEKTCPGPTRKVDCSLNNYIDCVQCGGLTGDYTEGTSCTNIKSCVCNTEVLCPLDCSWNFSDWNACAATCDGINPSRTGTRTRTYTVTRPAVNEGSCDLPLPEHLSQICTKTDCPVDCIGDWGVWTPCVATCDGINASRLGTRTRTYIIRTVAINGGAVCPIANDTT